MLYDFLREFDSGRHGLVSRVEAAILEDERLPVLQLHLEKVAEAEGPICHLGFLIEKLRDPADLYSLLPASSQGLRYNGGITTFLEVDQGRREDEAARSRSTMFLGLGVVVIHRVIRLAGRTPLPALSAAFATRRKVASVFSLTWTNVVQYPEISLDLGWRRQRRLSPREELSFNSDSSNAPPSTAAVSGSRCEKIA